MTERILVVLTGPVGGGKSTVGLALAECLRVAGRTAAVIDLDLVYCMARQHNGFGEMNIWTTARCGAAVLADAFFAEGMDVVIVEGEFFTQEELAALQDHLNTPARIHFVTLVVSYDVALKRVAGDPSRGMSRDPDFLRRLHDSFAEALPFLSAASLLIQADQRNPRELAVSIRDATAGG